VIQSGEVILQATYYRAPQPHPDFYDLYLCVKWMGLAIFCHSLIKETSALFRPTFLKETGLVSPTGTGMQTKIP
jgi:hypothetical protein